MPLFEFGVFPAVMLVLAGFARDAVPVIVATVRKAENRNRVLLLCVACAAVDVAAAAGGLTLAWITGGFLPAYVLSIPAGVLAQILWIAALVQAVRGRKTAGSGTGGSPYDKPQ